MTYRIRRFTVAEAQRMLRQGAVDQVESIELLDGLFVAERAPSGRALSARAGLAARLVADGCCAWTSERTPLRASDYDEPRADLLAIGCAPGELPAGVITGADVVLAVEIADGDVEVKRSKAVAYALAGVPEYWILDLANRRLEVARGPRGRGFVDVRYLDERDTVALPGGVATWTVSSLLA